MQIPFNKYVGDPVVNFVKTTAQSAWAATPAPVRTVTKGTADLAVRAVNFFPAIGLLVNSAVTGAGALIKFAYEKGIGTGYGQVVIASTVAGAAAVTGIFAAYGVDAPIALTAGFGGVGGLFSGGIGAVSEYAKANNITGEIKIAE
jgi:hypothetical protein